MPETGERALGNLQAGLSPIVAPDPYCITVEAAPTQAQVDDAFMVCREAEGVTLIVADDTRDIRDGTHYARITLQIHSSLEAVGLTATVSAALMHESIPANMVAGFYHDHVFVPWSMRERALAALQRLSDQSSDSA